MMHRPRLIAAVGAAGVVLALTLFAAKGVGVEAAEKPKTKVEIQLSESFYRALRDANGTTLSTDKSEAYLREIAVSSRFTVESNLKIIEQQRRIIELLEAIRQQGR